MYKTSAAVLTIACFTTSAFGHHGRGTFDHAKQLELVGTVTNLAFVNPHAYLYMDVSDVDGNVVAWRCEMRAATVLRRSGWSEEMFPTGGPLRVIGSPARREPHKCYVNTIEFGNGETADRYGQLSETTALPSVGRRPPHASGVPNLGGDWAAEQRVSTDPRGRAGTLVTLSVAQQRAIDGLSAGPAQAPRPPPGLRLRVELTEAGAEAVAGYNSETDNPRFTCQPTNIFFDWTFDQHINQIIQSDDRITMKYGFMDMQRTIHMDILEHPPDITPSIAGHSIGFWDGDVLVVDTLGFVPGYLDTRAGIMYSDQLHVVERFVYDHSLKMLSRSWVAMDSLYFEGQYTGQDTVFIADIPYEPYSCDDRTWQDGEF
ncbi:MAG TPA: hypothetical protein EYM99_10770 [Alphaproteobacteria bacterium]|nr:hypothetical protein [Alphaproteobacteria bacterium]